MLTLLSHSGNAVSVIRLPKDRIALQLLVIKISNKIKFE